MQHASTASLHIAKPNRHHLTEIEIIELQAEEWESNQFLTDCAVDHKIAHLGGW